MAVVVQRLHSHWHAILLQHLDDGCLTYGLTLLKIWVFSRARIALQLGLGIALEYILDIGVDAIWERVQSLAGLLRDELSQLPGATVRDKGHLLCGIVSFTLVSS